MKHKNKFSILLILFTFIFSTPNSFANDSKWNGTWTYPSRYFSGTLEITKENAKTFEFDLLSMNGANMGNISGIAKIEGNKAIYDDRLDKSEDAGNYGCVVTFTKKDSAIDVKTSDECSSYAGNAVYFEKEYKKGEKLPLIEQTLLQRGVFPDAKTDENFKKLTGKDYETFLDTFHLVFEEDEQNDLNAKVFSGCVRGICPYNAGIIMFDKAGKFYAMVFTTKEGSQEDSPVTVAHYYSNNNLYAGKLPSTIKKWYDDKVGEDGKVEIVYKNK